jgi:hypothetical protein
MAYLGLSSFNVDYDADLTKINKVHFSSTHHTLV